MGLFKENQSRNFLFPPKVGESITVTVVGQIERVKNEGGNADFNYKLKDKSNAGYYDVMDVVDPDGEEKQLMLNTWKLYFVLKEVGETLDVGDEIKIGHPGRGEYTVEKV